MTFAVTPDVEMRRDADGRTRSLRHLQDPYGSDEAGLQRPPPQSLADRYVRDVAPVYDVPEGMLSDLGRRFDGAPGRPTGEGSRLRPAEERRVRGTRVVHYRQTHLGLPVWRAGLTVRMHDDPLRVTSSSGSIHHEVDVDRPDLDDARFAPDRMDAERVLDALTPGEGYPPIDVEAEGAYLEASVGRVAHEEVPEVTDARALVYRYDPAARTVGGERNGGDESGPHRSGSPSVELPAVSGAVEPGRHYVVTEVLFSYPLEGWGNLNWRAFVEPRTGDVLYLRALVAGATGRVFPVDYLHETPQPDVDPCDDASALDPETVGVTLDDLDAPSSGERELVGDYVAVRDTDAPSVAPPTASTSSADFSAPATSDDFAAVSAYHYLDGLYRMVDDLGFDLSTYFDGTSFPVRVDHRGESGQAEGYHHLNQAGDGTDRITFGLCDPGCDLGIAADNRLVVHEFGHALLGDNLGSQNFGFAHSPGDALAAILNDPGTVMDDRFETYPWLGWDRRHDRDPTEGWAWGGTKHDAEYEYNGEQILSTTLFRAYRSTGGDAPNLEVKRFAARYMTYLVLGAVGSMMEPDRDPDVFATALMEADQGTDDFEGHPGGAFHKVIRWAFEKQGLYEDPDFPAPDLEDVPGDGVPRQDGEGNPPEVDVYVDDGRDGEYGFRRRFWTTEDVWNRVDDDGGTDHETPVVGRDNYAYVRVQNRGRSTAENVEVRGFHCRPGTGLTWPDDWKRMRTGRRSAGSIPPGGETVVGPFEWEPDEAGHECLLALVDADGDGANDATVEGPIPHWRFVPFDNNVAQRNVAPVAGGGGAGALTRSFEDRHFWVNNPYDRTVEVDLEVEMPAFLRDRGYELRVTSPGGRSFSLGPRDDREVVMRLEEGDAFDPADVRAADSRTVEVRTDVDGLAVGGMAYELDPDAVEPPREHPRDDGGDCEDAAGRLLDCLDLPDDVASVDVTGVSLAVDLEDDC